MIKVCIFETPADGGNPPYDVVHVSIVGQGAKLRRWPEGAAGWILEEVSPDEARAMIENAALSLTPAEAFHLADVEPAHGPGVGATEWGQVFQRLRQLLSSAGGLTRMLAQLSGAGKVRIPITTLSKMYTPMLRHIIHAKGFHELL